MTIERISSGGQWEALVGYSRVVKAGDWVLVAGTTATLPEGGLAGVGDPEVQARQSITNIEAALARAGATLADVVRTRIYVTDITQWEAIGRAHAAAFGAAPPVTAMVQVAAFVDPEMLVEIEADAWLGEP